MQKKLKPTTPARAKKKPSTTKDRAKGKKQATTPAANKKTTKKQPTRTLTPTAPQLLIATDKALPALPAPAPLRLLPMHHGEYSAATYPPTAPEQKPPPAERLITPPAHMVKVLDTVRHTWPAVEPEPFESLKTLTALAVDSRTVFVFWSLPQWEFSADGGPWSVRLYDATDSRDRDHAQHCWESAVDKPSATTYLQASPGREYFVRIGRRGLLGEFISMLESIFIHTPHEAPQPGPAALGDEHFIADPKLTQSS